MSPSAKSGTSCVPRFHKALTLLCLRQQKNKSENGGLTVTLNDQPVRGPAPKSTKREQQQRRRLSVPASYTVVAEAVFSSRIGMSQRERPSIPLPLPLPSETRRHTG